MELEISQVVITIVVVCLFLWRISYGTNNGLFAEAAGLIAVIASFAAVYYLTMIAGAVLNKNFGRVITKIGYLIVAFVVYRVMTALGNALRQVKEVPILGGLDRLCGGILGAVEAGILIYIVEFVTDFKLLQPAYATCLLAFEHIQKVFINF